MPAVVALPLAIMLVDKCPSGYTDSITFISTSSAIATTLTIAIITTINMFADIISVLSCHFYS